MNLESAWNASKDSNCWKIKPVSDTTVSMIPLIGAWSVRKDFELIPRVMDSVPLLTVKHPPKTSLNARIAWMVSPMTMEYARISTVQTFHNGIFAEAVSKGSLSTYRQDYARLKKEDSVPRVNISMKSSNYVQKYLLNFVDFLWLGNQMNVFNVFQGISCGITFAIHFSVARFTVTSMDVTHAFQDTVW